MPKIGVLVGSLRKESLSRKIANNVIKLFPQGYETEFVEIGNLPLYNQDYDDENNAPEAYIANSQDLLDEAGNIKKDDTVQYLQTVVDTFLELIKKYSS